MALVACWECSSQISQTSPSCPQCGAVQELNSEQLPSVGAANDEVSLLMAQNAKKQLVREGLLKTLVDHKLSKVHEKYYSSTGKGKKEFIAMEWRHFIVEEHEKDKSVTTHVSKQKGRTRGGTSYVKDVNVSQTTTYYDFIEAKNADGDIENFRLVDLDLKKIKSGQLISLGWIVHGRGEQAPVNLKETSSQIGQTWQDKTQPSMIVFHSDNEKSHSYSYQGLASFKFHEHFHSSAIGLWHGLWLFGLTGAYALYNARSEGAAIGLFAATVISSLIIKGVRVLKGKPMLAEFDNWYEDSIKAMSEEGSEALLQLRQKYGLETDSN